MEQVQLLLIHPQPDSFVQADFEFYLGKRASLFLTPEGEFKIIEGQSAEVPVEPKDLDNAMKLATCLYHHLHLDQMM